MECPELATAHIESSTRAEVSSYAIIHRKVSSQVQLVLGHFDSRVWSASKLAGAIRQQRLLKGL